VDVDVAIVCCSINVRDEEVVGFVVDVSRRVVESMEDALKKFMDCFGCE